MFVLRRLKPPTFHEQRYSFLSMASKRYRFHGLLFSSQMRLCSPVNDHVMSVTFFISVHSSL